MVSETMSDNQRRIRRMGLGGLTSGVAACAGARFPLRCGEDGNNVSCGKGTKLKGSTCVADQPIVDEPDASSAGGSPGAGGSGNAGSSGKAGMTGSSGAGQVDSGTTKDVLNFKGATSAA